MTLSTSIKQLIICTALSTTVVACGGSSGSGDKTPTDSNNTPTISTFTSVTSSTAALEVTFTWAVADADGDSLACVLNPGEGLDNVSIANCSTTTSTTVTYPTAGSYSANLQVSDPDNASSNKNLAITLTQANTAPVIDSFSAVESALEVTFSWSVSDSDGDDLSCVLTLGDGTTSTIADCLSTTTSTVAYQAAGSYTANLQVSDADNASSNQDVAITLVADTTLPDPVVTAGDNQLVIFYNRPDGNYTGWGLHVWANETCTAYDGPAIDWATPQAKSGDDPNYGAYWLVSIADGYSTTDCVNYIMHNGDAKAPNDADQQAQLSGERMIWLLNGIDEIYTEPTLFPAGVVIADSAAHWAAVDAVFWDVNDSAVAKVRVYSSSVDDLGFNGETGMTGDNFIEFAPATNNATALGMPRYSALQAFEATSPDSDKAKQMLTGKLLAIAYDSDDVVLAATYVQTPRVLDALYTASNADADEATLGLTYTDTDITANLWAPTAQQVSLQIFNAAKELQSTAAMVLDSDTGIWSFTTPISNDRLFYRYELTVYHHQYLQFETLLTTDPYSVSLSTNGDYSQFVNLSDADLKPTDWDSHAIPTIAAIEDAIIYEGNIRDFSILDDSTTAANRGKYLAFTEETSVPVSHLKDLVTAGLTHFQVLPANDIASVEEDLSKQINLTNTVAELCAVNAEAPVCGVEADTDTLETVFASYDASTNQATLLAQAMSGLDGYNFGYDPKHFNTPDGAFASDADGVSRIVEMRSMIKALHDLGLRTSLDVVYNHTNSSGLWDNSVLDKVVPGYYYRRDLTTGNVETETCCQDSETEHVMMDKLMLDSLVLWAQAYKFDAFRFDIMGSHSKDSILAARTAVQAVDADTYFYGEGWNREDRGYEQAAQTQLADSEVGTFNDRPRDIIRDASLFNDAASLNEQDIMRLGLAGTLQDYQLQNNSGSIESGKNYTLKPAYAKDPADIINYVSKHDGSTLWDKLQYGLATDMSVDDRVRAQNIAITMPILSQGIPFLQIGGDLLRSKSMDKNSYNNGDWFNRVDFTKTNNNWNVGLPLEIDDNKSVADVTVLITNLETTVQASHIAFASSVFQEFLAIRSSSPLFRLTTGQDVYDRVGFHNTGTGQVKGLIVMSIDDGTGLTDLDANNDALVVVINGTTVEQSYTVPTAAGFALHSVQQASVDSTVQAASFVAGASDGTFTVPALTTAVFVKPQGVSQGAGLAAGVTRDAPDIAPYGTNTLYIRGSMNDDGSSGFTAADTFTYDGVGVYSLETSLTAGVQSFTITSIDSVAVDLGFSDISIGSSSLAVTNNADSIDFTADTDGTYVFTLDASGDTPVLTISAIALTVDCSALTDSTDAIPFSITGGGQLYIRGGQSGWAATAEYQLTYKGDNKYQAVADFDGDFEFKIAADAWDGTEILAQATGSTSVNNDVLAVGTTYSVSHTATGGSPNNKTSLTAGTYSFLLELNEANPAEGSDVGTLIIQQCQP